MDFQQHQITNDLFDDISDSDNLFDDFDEQSQSSLLDVMVGAIKIPNKEQVPTPNQLDNFNIIILDNTEHDVHESVDHGLLSDGFEKDEDMEDLLVRDCSKATSTTAKVVPEKKIFKISTWTQKNGGHSRLNIKPNLTKEAPVIKENVTEVDSKEVITPVLEAKPTKRPRRDVTYKTILRKCRKYYQTKFNKITGYLKGKKKEPCSFYRACILKFIESSFEFNTNLNVSFHLGCLLYPTEMTRGIESFV